MFPPDFNELLSVFNSRRIRYRPIGGYAVSLHAQPRATQDWICLLGCAAVNVTTLSAALAEFGAPPEGLNPTDVMEPDTFCRMGAPPLMVDILPAIPGVDFDRAWERRVDIEIDPEGGLKAVAALRRTEQQQPGKTNELKTED